MTINIDSIIYKNIKIINITRNWDDDRTFILFKRILGEALFCSVVNCKNIIVHFILLICISRLEILDINSSINFFGVLSFCLEFVALSYAFLKYFQYFV